MASKSEDTTRKQLTQVLVSSSDGNKQALDLLTPLVYGQRRKVAYGYLNRESNQATLQPTALVHEAYMRLVAQDLPDWKSRANFFAVASQLMRQIIVDHARKFRSQKRGSGAVKAPFEDALHAAQGRTSDVVALDDALTELAKFDGRKWASVTTANTRVKSR